MDQPAPENGSMKISEKDLPPGPPIEEEEKETLESQFKGTYYNEEFVRKHKLLRNIHPLIANLAKNNRFEVIKYVSGGTYSRVSTVRSTVSGNVYAMKTVKKRSRDDTIPFSFLKEVLFAHGLKHTNIVDFKTCCSTKSEEGHTLFNLVFNLYPTNLDYVLFWSGVDITLEDTKYLIHSLLSGLKYIHSKRVIHRDVKPCNICISHDGILKIIDFGMATFGDAKADSKSVKSCDVCTPGFVAPELLFGCTRYGTEIDVWSAGIVAAEILLRQKMLENGDNSEQLSQIANLFGSISEENWPNCEKLPLWNDHKEVVTGKGFGTISRTLETSKALEYQFYGVQLVMKMTKLCPNQRCSVLDAMNDKWFECYPVPSKNIKSVIDNIKKRHSAKRSN